MLNRRIGEVISTLVIGSLLAFALVAMITSPTQGAAGAPVTTPTVVSAPTPAATIAPVPTVQSFADWQAHQVRGYIMPVAFEVALRDRGWPIAEAERMTNIAENCEAAAYNAAGVPIGINIGLIIVDSDGFLTVGPGIHLVAHPGIEERHDLATLAGTADALTEIRDEAIRVWGPTAGLRPWSCAR